MQSDRRRDRANAHHVAENLHVNGREERLRQRSGHHAGGRLSRARSLQHVARVVEPVFLHAREIGVTRARSGQFLRRSPRTRRHLLLPLRPLGVQDLYRDRRTERSPVAHAPDEANDVALKAHPGASAETETAPRQFLGHVFVADREACRQALDDDTQRRTVTLTSREEAQHCLILGCEREWLFSSCKKDCRPTRGR